MKEKQKDIISLIRRKASSLVLEQAKVLLDTKVDKMEEELTYVRDRLARTDIKLNEARNAISEIEPRVDKSESMMNTYRDERDGLHEKCKNLKDVEEKIKIIAERKEVIEKSSEAVADLIEQKSSLERSDRDIAHTREIKEEKLRADTEQRNRLEEDIRVLKGKIARYSSRMTEYSTVDELKSEQARAKKDIRVYTAKVTKTREALKKVDRDLSRLRSRSDKKISEKDALLSRRDELQEKISELEALGDKDALHEEVKGLKDRKKTLSADIKSKTLEYKRLESMLVEAGEAIENEKEFESNASARLEELTLQKREIDNAEYVIKMINLNIEVNKRFRAMIERATHYLTPVIDKVGAVTQDYQKEINKLSRLIHKRLGRS